MISNFEINQIATKCLLNIIPNNWTITPPDVDIGVDYWVQLTHKGKSKGLSFYIQLKGTTKLKQTNSEVLFRIKTKKLKEYISEEKPILLVICDISEDRLNDNKIYYQWIQDYIRYKLDFKGKYPKWWIRQKFVTLRLPIDNVLKKDVFINKLEPYISNFQERHNKYEDDKCAQYSRFISIKENIKYFDEYLKRKKIKLNKERIKELRKLSWIGLLLSEDLKYLEAIELLLKAQQILPTPVVSVCLSYCYEAIGKNYEALKQLNMAIDLDPDGIDINTAFAWSNKGTILFRMGKYTEGLNHHYHALKLFPKEAMLWACVAASLEFIATEINLSNRSNLLIKAQSFYETAIKINPNIGFIWEDLGLVLEKRYMFREAKEVLSKAVEINPKSALAWTRLSRIYGTLHDFEKSLNALEKAIKYGGETENLTKNKKLLLKELSHK